MNQETADAMLNKLEVLTDGSLTIAGVFEEMEEYINSLVVEDEGFTKPCTCGSTMHLQHHWECLNCKKGTNETNEEISLRMWEEYMVDIEKEPIYKQSKTGSIWEERKTTFPDWLKEKGR